jgi:lipopolysaccharide/colanic/teichoic acid biosynthesis glycosyltransferase
MSRRSEVGPGLSTRIVKQTIDILGSTAVLAVLSPLMVGLAGAIWLTMGRPILYRQMRPGLRERPFRVWKFRTMSEARDARGQLLPDGERLTALGRWLREWSLDELPQFVNVLKGDMSLVGPRPLLLRYLDRYTPRQRLRHAVKPGISGWAQVNGRNAADWDTRLEHDVWYAEHVSVALDARILFLTCLRLVQRSDVLAGGGSELEEFWGTQGVPETGPRAYPVEADERL